MKLNDIRQEIRKKVINISDREYMYADEVEILICKLLEGKIKTAPPPPKPKVQEKISEIVTIISNLIPGKSIFVEKINHSITVELKDGKQIGWTIKRLR